MAVLGAGAGAAWGFVALVARVSGGGARAFDERLLLALRDPANPADPLGPRWLEETARDITALGSNGVLALLVLTVLGYLLLAGKRHAAAVAAAAVAGGSLLTNLLKAGFDRPRPELVPHAAEVFTSSFPSSHAMMSAVTYLTLGALLARVQPDGRIKVYLLAVAALLALLVGASRVYLGVHWPTDVLAGWAAGSAWAALCWLAATWLQRRGAVEPDDGPPGRGAEPRRRPPPETVETMTPRTSE